MKCITFNKEAQNNLPKHIKYKMKEDRNITELEKEVKIKLLKVTLNKSDLSYAKRALTYIEELEQKLNMRKVTRSIGKEIPVLGVLTEDQVNRMISACKLCRYKEYSEIRQDCSKCINEGQPNQYYL